MDYQHFDDLTRTLGQRSLNRRAALRLLGATLLGGGLSATGASRVLAKPTKEEKTAQKEAEKTLKADQKDCPGLTGSFAWDSRNCGACGNSCEGGEQCVEGECVLFTTCTGRGGGALGYYDEVNDITWSDCQGGDSTGSYRPDREVCYTCDGQGYRAEGEFGHPVCTPGEAVICAKNDPTCGPPAQDGDGICLNA